MPGQITFLATEAAEGQGTLTRRGCLSQTLIISKVIPLTFPLPPLHHIFFILVYFLWMPRRPSFFSCFLNLFCLLSLRRCFTFTLYGIFPLSTDMFKSILLQIKRHVFESSLSNSQPLALLLTQTSIRINL